MNYSAMRMLCAVLLLAAAVLATWTAKVEAQQPVLDGAGGPAAHRGGSDFIFFNLRGCERAQFAVVPGYAGHRAIVDGQLTAMFRDGQRRLRISLPVRSAAEASSGDDVAHRESIRDLLQTVRNIGYEEILVVIGGGSNPPDRWRVWDEAAYQQRWQQIIALRSIVAGSGLRYHLDLLNEGIPARNQRVLLEYTRRLWADYSRRFGVADTVGFSIITDIAQDRFAQIPAVYQGRFPPAFDLHVYDRPRETVLNAQRRLWQLGLGAIPWIIGETYYNDARSAKELGEALRVSRRKVLFLLQWPLTPHKSCAGVDVAFPARFDNYMAIGF